MAQSRRSLSDAGGRLLTHSGHARWWPSSNGRIMKCAALRAPARSRGLDVGCPNHLGPLLSFFGDQLSELNRRSRQRDAAEVSETSLYLWIVESLVDLFVKLVDCLDRRRFRCADAPPDGRFVARHKLTDSR